jgi:hypothetical protein
MSESESGRAELVSWDAPGGVPMSLAVPPGSGGTLDVTIRDGAVVVRGSKCLLGTGDRLDPGKRTGERAVAEIHMTLALARCQVVWKSSE